jgi:hypothetical protein
MKTSELTGAALDWAVAKCEGPNSAAACYYDEAGLPMRLDEAQHMEWQPSTNWAQGGPIIEREGIDVHRVNAEMWSAKLWVNNSGMTKNPAQWFKHNIQTDGPTPLIAAMRCYCCAKLGDEIDIPEELCHQQNS